MYIKSAVFFIIGAALFASGLFLGEKEEPLSDVGLSPAPKAVAAAICENAPPFDKSVTVFVHKVIPTNDHFEALYQDSNGRYDLTWRDGVAAIAVEHLVGRDTDNWAEERTAEFDSCIASKTIPVEEAPH